MYANAHAQCDVQHTHTHKQNYIIIIIIGGSVVLFGKSRVLKVAKL